MVSAVSVAVFVDRENCGFNPEKVLKKILWPNVRGTDLTQVGKSCTNPLRCCTVLRWNIYRCNISDFSFVKHFGAFK